MNSKTDLNGGPAVGPTAATGSGMLTLPVVLLAQFTIPLSIAGVAVGLPLISRQLGSEPAALQWVVNGFNVAFALCTLGWGAAADHLGQTRTFRMGVGLCLIGSLGASLARSLVVLDVTRAVAGIGAGAVIVGATTILSRTYSGTQRTTAFAWFGTMNGLGLAAGPSLSGALVSAFGWRAVFLTHGIALALALAGSIALPRVSTSQPAVEAPDVPAPPVTADLRHPGYLAMLVVPVAGAIGFVTLLTYFPGALQSVRGQTPAAAGAIMLAMTVPVLVGPLAIDQLRRTRFSPNPMLVCGIALVCLVVAPLALTTFDESSSTPVLLIILFVGGLGFGLPLGIVDAQALSFVPAARQGVAAGVLNFFRIGGEALFVALYAMALAWLVRRRAGLDGRADDVVAGQPGHAGQYLQGLHPLLIGVAALAGVCLLVFLLLVRRTNARQ